MIDAPAENDLELRGKTSELPPRLTVLIVSIVRQRSTMAAIMGWPGGARRPRLDKAIRLRVTVLPAGKRYADGQKTLIRRWYKPKIFKVPHTRTLASKRN
jgi:hypothetical protein